MNPFKIRRRKCLLLGLILPIIPLISGCSGENSSSGVVNKAVTTITDQRSCEAAEGSWLKGECIGAIVVSRSAEEHDGSQENYGDHKHGDPNDPPSSWTDLDGDGISNVLDLDADGDGIPNRIDSDDDNDGVPDVSDKTPLGPSTEPKSPEAECKATGGIYQRGECTFPEPENPSRPSCPIDASGAYPKCECTKPGYTYSSATNTCNSTETGKPSEYCPSSAYGTYPKCFCDGKQTYNLALNICESVDTETPSGCEEAGGEYLRGECTLNEKQCPKGAGGTPPACSCPSGSTYVAISNTCEPNVLPPTDPGGPEVHRCPEDNQILILGKCVFQPIECPAGTQFNPLTGACRDVRESCPDGWTVVNEGGADESCIPPPCPPGESWDSINNTCVATPLICPDGYRPNDNGATCEEIPIILECLIGYEKNEAGECVLLPEQCTGGLVSDGNGNCIKPEPEECPDGQVMNSSGDCIEPEPEQCSNGSTGAYPECPIYCDDGSLAPHDDRDQCAAPIQCSSINNKASGIYPDCSCDNAHGNVVWDSTLGNGKGGCRNANASQEACENEGGIWKGNHCQNGNGNNVNQGWGKH